MKEYKQKGQKESPKTSVIQKEAVHESHQEQADDTKPIPINGFQQIVDMLKVADPVFRESLLKRLAARDSRLAHSLRQDLGK